MAVNGRTNLTVKEAIVALAPTLERMRKRGFELPEIVEKLHEKGIEVKAPTLAKYLNECRRGKGKKAEGKIDTPPPSQRIGNRTTERVSAVIQTTEKNAPRKDREFPLPPGGFVVTPDIPLDEL